MCSLEKLTSQLVAPSMSSLLPYLNLFPFNITSRGEMSPERSQLTPWSCSVHHSCLALTVITMVPYSNTAYLQ